MTVAEAKLQRTELNEEGMATLFNKLVLESDLSNLNPVEMVHYYHEVCRNAGLDPMTKPFDIIVDKGKKRLYANKTATAQLTKNHKLSVNIVDKVHKDGIFMATARVKTQDGATVDDIGAISTHGLQGEALANAMMKATTKAKRRAVLSACGIGLNDENELDMVGMEKLPNEIKADDLATLTDEEVEAVLVFRSALGAIEDGDDVLDEMTEIKDKIKGQPENVRTALQDDMKATMERLKLIFVKGAFAKQVLIEEGGSNEKA